MPIFDKAAAQQEHEVFTRNFVALRKVDGETQLPVYSLPGKSLLEWVQSFF